MSSGIPTSFRGAAYGRLVRVVRASLVTIAGISMPALLVLVVVANDPPVTPDVLVRLFGIGVAGPAAAAWAMRHLLATEVSIAADSLIITRWDRRFEIPRTALVRISPWKLPLPGPGLTLYLHSGRRLAWGIELPDAAALVRALGLEPTAPVLAYASARAATTATWRWYHWIAKYPLFGLLPTLPLFHVHQHIVYGGLLGQYHLLGARAYVKDFLIHWVTVSIGLALWAGCWRGLAEGLALGAAVVAPSHAARVRQAAETACRCLYYAGVPLLVALRFAPW